MSAPGCEREPGGKRDRRELGKQTGGWGCAAGGARGKDEERWFLKKKKKRQRKDRKKVSRGKKENKS